MIIVGVTGNTGAGKTTVSTIIKNNMNAVVIDADKISKDLMQPGEEYYEKILELFGRNEVLHSKTSKNRQKINRTKLAKIIFEDEEKREMLNTLTFKYVGKEIKKQILENKDREMIVLDIPLLYEGGYDKICNYVIAVVSSEDAKIERIFQRDKISREEVKTRLKAQQTDDFFKERANYVINNPGSYRYIALVKDTIKVIHDIKDKEAKK